MKNFILKIFAGILIYFIASFSFKSYKNSQITDSCLNNTFQDNFAELSQLNINSVYDFNEMFKCQEWDEIFVVSSMYYSRGIGYLSTGVLIPDYEPFDYAEGTALVFFLNNNIVISKPMALYSDNFIFSNNYEKMNSIRIKRTNAKFIYKEFEDSDYEFTTLELISK